MANKSRLYLSVLGLLVAVFFVLAQPEHAKVAQVGQIAHEIASQPQEPSASAGPYPDQTEITVSRAVDGDTIQLSTGQTLRYIGIDTPETVDPRKPVQCFGVEAKKRNQDLVEGKAVRLQKDVSETDRYGRLLRYVWVGDTFINLELVKEGYARSDTFPPDVKYQQLFLQAEQEARVAKIGLWGSCSENPSPSSTLNPSPVPLGPCTIKGNISANGEKIYHLPTCGSYAKTQIDEARGEKWFCTEAEAQAAGWRKAGNCD